MARKKADAVVTPEEQPVPTMIDPQWTDFVLERLTEEEKDPNGNPSVDGLRRLTEAMLGPIVYSVSHVVAAACEANGDRATVEHVIKIAWNRNFDDIRTFGDAADVSDLNTDPEYARHTAATAATKAESRALRKALRLRKVVAAEELTDVPVVDTATRNLIIQSQKKGIDMMCRNLDIDVLKFVNSFGEDKYEHIGLVRYDVAKQMLEKLNGYQRAMDTIPETIVGYDPAYKNGDF